MSFLNPPYHPSLNQSRELALGDMLANSKFNNLEYILKEGTLILPNNGKPLSVVVAAGMEGPDSDHLEEVKSVFEKFLHTHQAEDVIYPQEIREFFIENLQDRLQVINQNLKRERVEDLTNLYGLSPILLSEHDILSVMQNCSNAILLGRLIKGSCEASELVPTMAGVFTQRLQQQEDEILSNLPDSVFESPETLRQALTLLLDEKGLTYAEAVSQFDYSIENQSAVNSTDSTLMFDNLAKKINDLLNKLETSRIDSITKLNRLSAQQSQENDINSLIQTTFAEISTKFLEEIGMVTAETSFKVRSLTRKEPPRQEGCYVLAKLIAQVDAWEALLTHSKATGLPFKDVWRYFIDESKEAEGAYRFENEPFYMLSSLRGFTKILNEQAPPSRTSYEGYLKALTHSPAVLKHPDPFVNKNCIKKFFSLGMQKGYRSYEWKPWKHDPIGVEDLESRSRSKDGAINLVEKQSNRNIENLWLAYSTSFIMAGNYLSIDIEKDPSLLSDRIFLGLEQMLESARSPGERLIAYIWAARELEINHVLEDGNGRTAIMALVKWIAEDSELPMYMPEDPNILDSQSAEAIIRDVHSGMMRYWKLSNGQSAPVPSLDELISQAGVQDEPWSVIHKRAQLPDETIEMLVKKYC